MDIAQDDLTIIAAVQRWLDQVVVGLNLCPFSAEPNRKQQIRIQVSHAEKEETLLTELQSELRLIDEAAPTQIETTLLVIPHLLADFEQYNHFLELVELLLVNFGWDSNYQIASFHPDYCFADTDPDDASNLTNRSPYPILHILREASIDEALDHYADPDQIPERNIQKMQSLSLQEKQHLFPYL